MSEKDWLALEFERKRGHLAAVACRMLGSRAEADDAVQEAWLRLGRSDVSEIDNIGGWLTTVVARICLDMLRSRKSRREEPLELSAHGRIVDTASATDPEREVAIAGSVGAALLVLLQTLSPAERVAFVLHDMFDLTFDEIAPIIRRSSAATRQLASRARRRLQGKTDIPEAEFVQKRTLVSAFLAASRAGDLQALIAVLDPQVVFTPDATAMRLGAVEELQGASAVAEAFKGRAQAARPAMVDGELGLVVAPDGELRVALMLVFDDNRISAIDAVADPDQLIAIRFAFLDD
jgi:RNA polymerase sigma-70 factor (ECF subfamily)